MGIFKRGRRAGAVGGLVGASLLLAACGSSSSTSSSSSSSSSSSTSSAPAATTSSSSASPIKPYSGAETQLPHAEPASIKKPGYSFTIGWLIPNGSIPSRQELTTGIKREASALGGKVIALDSQHNPQTEVSNFNQLLSQHVSGIIFFPLDPASLAPSLAQAKKQGIPVVAIDAPPAASSPLIKGYIADILLSRDLGAYAVARKAAALNPGGTFALLGIAAPIPSLNYVIAQEKQYGEADGLKFVGEIESHSEASMP